MSEQPIDKKALKIALEEMLKEGNPELKGLFEEILVKFLANQALTDRSMPLDMDIIRKKYALRREAFAPLHEIFKDAPAAVEMAKKYGNR